MKRYVSWLVCGLFLVLAGFCSAADSISIPLDCKGLQASGAGQQRIEVPAAGFLVIPLRATLALPEFGTEHPSPEQIKVVVDELISHHFFSQVVGGVSSAERHFQLVESHSAVDGSFGVSCVRFDAKVAEQGAFLAPPNVVINLNFFDNLVCAHPQPTSAKSSLVWISFVEVYREGDQSAAATLSREVEPLLRSLEFTGPRIVRHQINHQIF